ncbi:MAG: hypothetical protein WAX69_24215 [Victivallales bacterium]
MKTKVGLWIDHRKAVVVTVTDKGEELGLKIAKVESDVEKQLRRSGDSPLKGPYEPSQVPADDSRTRALTGHLNIYYDEVIAGIRNAESILIFGPGSARDELKERLVKSNLGGCIAGVEASDKMSDRQITAKVKNYFTVPVPWQANKRVTDKRVTGKRAMNTPDEE